MKKRLLAEYSHFCRLSQPAQRLVISSAVYSLAYPILFVFINAFLFRQTNDFMMNAVYNAGSFVVLPLSFLLNGLLLKKFPIKNIFSIGLVSQGLVATSVFFLENINLQTLFLFGGAQGLAMGLYWANRNYLTVECTQDKERNYYTSLEWSVDTVINVVVPAVMGLVIAWGSSALMVSPEKMYRGLALFAVLMLLWAGRVMTQAEVENPKFMRLFVGAGTAEWLKVRMMDLFFGVRSGVEFFLPVLIVFTMIGVEDVLGMLKSITALITGGFVYFMGRKTQVKHRLPMLAVGVMLSIMISLFFAIVFNSLAALILVSLLPVFNLLTWVSLHPVALKTLDDQENGTKTNNYAYVVDREIFLNIGRLTGVGLFLLTMQQFSSGQVLRIMPLVISVFQLGLLFSAWRLTVKN